MFGLTTARLIAYGVAGAALAGGLAWAVHDVRSAYRARAALPLALAERNKARAETAAMAESARLTGALIGRTEEKVADTGRQAAKIRVVYREAARTDPTCVEWARQPVGCPIGGRQ